MTDALGEIIVSVKQEGADEAAEKIEESTESLEAGDMDMGTGGEGIQELSLPALDDGLNEVASAAKTGSRRLSAGLALLSLVKKSVTAVIVALREQTNALASLLINNTKAILGRKINEDMLDQEMVADVIRERFNKLIKSYNKQSNEIIKSFETMDTSAPDSGESPYEDVPASGTTGGGAAEGGSGIGSKIQAGLGKMKSGISGMAGKITGGISSAMPDIGSLLKPLMGMSKMMLGILGAVGAIALIFASLEPIQEMGKAFMKVIQAFFIPLATIIISALQPVLRWLIKLLPGWFKFIENFSWREAGKKIWIFFKRIPEMIWSLVKQIPSLILKAIKTYLVILTRIEKIAWNALQKLGSWLWKQIKKVPGLIKKAIITYLEIWTRFGEILWNQLKSLGSWIWGKIQHGINFITNLPSKIWDYMKDLPSMIWDYMQRLPSEIASRITSAVPGFQSGGIVPRTGLIYAHEDEMVLNPEQMGQLVRALEQSGGGGTVHVALEGDLREMAGLRHKDPNVGGR